MANGFHEEGVLRIGPPEPPARRRGRAVRFCAEASLVLAVLALACICFGMTISGFPEMALAGLGCVPLVLVLGMIGRRRDGEARFVANCGILLTFPAFLLFLIPANIESREVARRAQFTNNLKQVGLALHTYHSVYGRLPPAVVRDRRGRPLYSWRVLILPYLDSGDVYRDFHLDERWDSPHNQSLLDRAPLVYQGVGVEGDRELTFIQVFVGPGSAFESLDGEPFDKPNGAPNFPDGMDRTILAVEGRVGVPWSAPFDLPTGTDMSATALGGGFRRERGFMQRQAEVTGFHILLADGMVKWVKFPISPANLRALVTRNGNDAMTRDDF